MGWSGPFLLSESGEIATSGLEGNAERADRLHAARGPRQAGDKGLNPPTDPRPRGLIHGGPAPPEEAQPRLKPGPTQTRRRAVQKGRGCTGGERPGGGGGGGGWVVVVVVGVVVEVGAG